VEKECKVSLKGLAPCTPFLAKGKAGKLGKKACYSDSDSDDSFDRDDD